jgi:hypothetical protein
VGNIGGNSFGGNCTPVAGYMIKNQVVQSRQKLVNILEAMGGGMCFFKIDCGVVCSFGSGDGRR